MKSPNDTRPTPAETLGYNWFLLRPWIKTIALTSLVCALVTFLVTQFLMVHYYQATAVIRPISQSEQGNLLSGMLAGVTSTLGSLTGLSSDEEKDAEKYISMVSSY